MGYHGAYTQTTPSASFDIVHPINIFLLFGIEQVKKKMIYAIYIIYWKNDLSETMTFDLFCMN